MSDKVKLALIKDVETILIDSDMGPMDIREIRRFIGLYQSSEKMRLTLIDFVYSQSLLNK